MGLLTADNPRDTAIAWVFVTGQLLLILLVLALPAGDSWTTSDEVRAVARLASLAGAGVLVIGLVNLGRSLTPLPTPIEHGELRTRGLYRLVRHPIYSGLIALVAGSAVPSGNPASVVAALALTGWFMAKARWEEHHLRRRYPGYDDYAAGTPRFVPFWPFGADRR
jgi:protein-S-isoprenylcysteine O-methyltransferase Ste14